MDAKQFLGQLIDVPGVSGYENKISKMIMEAFEPYCDEVYRDAFYNVYGKKLGNRSGHGPKVMLAAHLDEIGLMVKDIDEKGFISFTNIGGVDQRILLSQEVYVHGKEKLWCDRSQTAPSSGKKGSQKAVPMKEMAIDVGLPAEKVKELVSIGDLITFKSPLVELKGTNVRQIH